MSLLSNLISKTVEQCEKMTCVNEFASQGFPLLKEVFDSAGYPVTIDENKVQELINHTGITGAVRGYFTFVLNGQSLDLTIMNLHSIATDKKVLAKLMSSIGDLVQYLEENVIKNNTSEFKKGNKIYSGDIFYSDLSLHMDEFCKKHNFRSAAYSIACSYLQEKNFLVHS